MSGYEEFMTAIKEKGFPAAKPCDPDQFDDPEELKKILDNIMGEEIAGRFKGGGHVDVVMTEKEKMSAIKANE